MFDYEKYRAAAYKYKYETALETERRRISYKELYAMTDAFCNSLCVANPSGGSVAVLLRACPEAVCAYFACVKAGFDCISADSRLSLDKARLLAEKYRPTVVVMPSMEFSRLSDIFLHHDCKTAVFTGEAPQEQLFPAQFGFDILLEKNNYAVMDKKQERRTCEHIFFDGNGFKDSLPSSLFELPVREPVYIGLPIYENAGSLALTELLYSGRRCFIPQELNPAIFKRKKIHAAICDKLSKPSFSETFRSVFEADTDTSKPFVYAGGGTLYTDAIGKYLSSVTGYSVSCLFDGTKIRIAVSAEDIRIAEDAELIKAIKNVCADILYAYDMPKSVVFVKKTV